MRESCQANYSSADRRQALRPVVDPCRGEARDLARPGARAVVGVPRPYLAGPVLPATLADAYRRRLAAAGFDPFDQRVQQAPPWRDLEPRPALGTRQATSHTYRQNCAALHRQRAMVCPRWTCTMPTVPEIPVRWSTGPLSEEAPFPRAEHRRRRGTSSCWLALSFSHFLNDMIQSLLPAIYPILKASYQSDLRPDRTDHADVPDHRLAAATAGRAISPTSGRSRISLAIGMGFTLCGLLLLSQAESLCPAPGRRRAWSAWARRFSIRSPRAWRGLPRAAAMAWRNRSFQVGGNIGSSAGPAARGLHRRASRPSQHRLVLAGRAAGDRRAVATSAAGTAAIFHSAARGPIFMERNILH